MRADQPQDAALKGDHRPSLGFGAPTAFHTPRVVCAGRFKAPGPRRSSDDLSVFRTVYFSFFV